MSILKIRGYAVRPVEAHIHLVRLFHSSYTFLGCTYTAADFVSFVELSQLAVRTLHYLLHSHMAASIYNS